MDARAGRLPRAGAAPLQREPARGGGGARRPRRRASTCERTLAVTHEGLALPAPRARARSALEMWPTDANFVLVRAGAGIYDLLLREGVIVRPLGGFGLPEHVRITIGTPEENERLVRRAARAAGARVSGPAFERVASWASGSSAARWPRRARARRRRAAAWSASRGCRETAAAARARAASSTKPARRSSALVAGADLVVLATPLGAMPELLRRAAPALAEGCVVTDVGSVKGSARRDAARPPPARRRLRRRAPDGREPPARPRRRARRPLRGRGLRAWRPGARHARRRRSRAPRPSSRRSAPAWSSATQPATTARSAWVSHLPHAIAFAYAAALDDAPAGAAAVRGTGFRDFTRIARSDPELWAEILCANRKALAGPLARAGGPPRRARPRGRARRRRGGRTVPRERRATRSRASPETTPDPGATSRKFPSRKEH